MRGFASDDTADESCPKCSGHMESGFIRDRAAGAANLQAKWVEGSPTSSFWSGDRVNMQGVNRRR